ncbi:hypothetical protein LTR53_001363 [Teratosphaeriaceae sp. CCFEE 6253]|nr:hypothetical protein LTR53_001363 [Teratosphaeriaceae sp. CCFEE 6253]
MPPPPILAESLCELYFRNVDPVFKVLHAPSVRSHVKSGARYLDYDAGHRAVTALKFVLYYAALATATEEECVQLCGQPKALAIGQYRTMAEAALTQADYVISNDLTTLQSFIIYLAVLRHEDQTRRTWSLTALALRSAVALGLHIDKPHLEPFITEQRRRTWHALCVLDLLLAVDLASDALIITGTYDTALPLNIDDADMAFGSHLAITSRTGWTEMTFTTMIHVIHCAARRSHSLKSDNGQARQAIILDAGDRIEKDYLVYCDPDNHIQAFSIATGRSIVAACLLHSVFPTKAHAKAGSTGPPIKSEHVLSIAIDTLSYSQQCAEDPYAVSWQWIAWRQWHALAVAYAALGFITEGPLAERGWAVVEPAYSHYSAIIAGRQGDGMYQHLVKFRDRALRSRAGVSKPGHTSMPNAQDYVPHAATPGQVVDDVDATWAFDDPSADDWAAWSELFHEMPDPMDFGPI